MVNSQIFVKQNLELHIAIWSKKMAITISLLFQIAVKNAFWSGFLTRSVHLTLGSPNTITIGKIWWLYWFSKVLIAQSKPPKFSPILSKKLKILSLFWFWRILLKTSVLSMYLPFSDFLKNVLSPSKFWCIFFIYFEKTQWNLFLTQLD